MATLIVRNLDESVEASLRLRAAQHGRTVEAEVCSILKETTAPAMAAEPEEHLWYRVRRLVAQHGGLDIEIPFRDVERFPPDFMSDDYAAHDE